MKTFDNKNTLIANIILALLVAGVMVLLSHLIGKPEGYSFVTRLAVLFVPAFYGVTMRDTHKAK